MTRYIKLVTAKRCPVHQVIVSAATDFLLDRGYFSKDEVINETGMRAMEEAGAIRWDYIARMVEESSGDMELLPIVKRFWRASDVERSDPAHAAKCLAGGHGKKTAGYALVCRDNKEVVTAALERRRANANGVGKAFRYFADEVVRRDAIADGSQKLLESVTN